jgi:hypothetical protein
VKKRICEASSNSILAQNSEHSQKKSLTSQIQRQRSQRGVALQRVAQRLRSFIAEMIDYSFQTQVQQTVPMATLLARQSQQSPQSHSLHGSIGRASPQSTWNNATSGVFPTLELKKTRNTNHQRNQDHSQYNSSENEVSVVLSFRASPNALAPSSSI